MSTKHIRTSLYVALGLAGLSCTGADLTGTQEEALTAEQCSFFAEGDKVQICHHTGSARKPYTIIRTNIASCGGHADHDGDYVTSADPTSPLYDPTCSGQGCLPEGAPADASIECCVGLADVGGVCTDIDECATDNGGCGAGRTCADGALPGQAPTCTDIDECLTDNGGCGTGYTCTNHDGAPPTCTDIDECAAEVYPCGSNTSCENTAGGFACECVDGYRDLDGACTDIDECAVGNGGCAGDQTCSNNLGAPPTCTANPDLVRNGSFQDGTFSPVQGGSWVDVFPGETKLSHWNVASSTGHPLGWHNTAETRPMQDGDRAVDLVYAGRCISPGAANATVYQSIATVPGATYKMVFHSAAPYSGDPCSSPSGGSLSLRKLTAFADAQAYNVQVSPSWYQAMIWSSYSFTFVATNTSTKIGFTVPGYDNGYWGAMVDGVNVRRIAP